MAGFSSGSGYLDPHRVYELVIRRMPALLLEYLDSVPVPSRDMHWQGIRLVGNALRNLLSQVPRSSSVEDNRDILSWAQLAQFHAIKSRSVARDGRFCLGLCVEFVAIVLWPVCFNLLCRIFGTGTYDGKY